MGLSVKLSPRWLFLGLGELVGFKLRASCGLQPVRVAGLPVPVRINVLFSVPMYR